MTDNQRIIPACEQYKYILDRETEIRRIEGRAPPDPDTQPEVDYSGFDGA